MTKSVIGTREKTLCWNSAENTAFTFFDQWFSGTVSTICHLIECHNITSPTLSSFFGVIGSKTPCEHLHNHF